MKIKKKIMIIIASVFIILGTVFPKQNDEKVEAFAVTGTALAIGTVATLIVGGTLVNQAVTENYGQDIIEYMGDKVADISDYINYDRRTRLFNIVTSLAVLNAIHNVTIDKVEDIDINQTPGIAIPGNYEFSYRPGMVKTYHEINPTNATAFKNAIENYVGHSTLTVTLSNAILGNNPYIEIGYVTATGSSTLGEVFDVIENNTGTLTLTSRGRIRGSAHRHLPANSMYISIGATAPSAYPPLVETAITDITFSNSNAISIDYDLVDQFKTVPRAIDDLEDRIASIPIDASMTIALPRDVTSVSTFDEVILGSADDIIADDDIPIDDDTGSGVFAVISNIWNFLKSLPGLLANAFVGLFDYIVENIQSLMDSISSMFGSLMQLLSSLFSELWTIAGTIVQPIWEIIGDLWQHVNTITNAISTGIDTVSDWLSQILESFTNSISTGIDTVSDWLSQILESLINGAGAVISFPIDIFNALLNTVVDAYNAFDTWSRTFANSIADAVVGIVVPTDTMLDKIKTTFNELRAEFLLRFEFITVPIKSISTVFSSPKSLYDLNIEILNEKVHVMPRAFESAINYARPIFTGVIVLITIIGIYKKVTVKEVV